jgi:hypothetical protein
MILNSARHHRILRREVARAAIALTPQPRSQQESNASSTRLDDWEDAVLDLNDFSTASRKDWEFPDERDHGIMPSTRLAGKFGSTGKFGSNCCPGAPRAVRPSQLRTMHANTFCASLAKCVRCLRPVLQRRGMSVHCDRPVRAACGEKRTTRKRQRRQLTQHGPLDSEAPLLTYSGSLTLHQDAEGPPCTIK